MTLAEPCGPPLSPVDDSWTGAPADGPDSSVGSASGIASVPVVVEVLRIGVHQGGLRWHPIRTALLSGQAPDTLARHLAGIDDSTDTGCALHSTSWRHTDGEVVLTYAAFPDPHATASWAAPAEHLAACAGPVHPSPTDIDGHHVAAQAIRHLADLAAGRDPHLTACARRQPEPWRLLLQHARGVHVHPIARQSPGPGPDST